MVDGCLRESGGGEGCAKVFECVIGVDLASE